MRQYSYGRDVALYEALVEGDDGLEKVSGPLGGALAGGLIGGAGGYVAGDERGALVGALGGAGLGAGVSTALRGHRLRGIGEKGGVMFRDKEESVKDLLDQSRALTADDVMKARSATKKIRDVKDLTAGEALAHATAGKRTGAGTPDVRRYSDVSYKGKGKGKYTVGVGNTKVTVSDLPYDDLPDAARMSMIMDAPVLEGSRNLSESVAKELKERGMRRLVGGAGLAAVSGVGLGVGASRLSQGEKRAARDYWGDEVADTLDKSFVQPVKTIIRTDRRNQLEFKKSRAERRGDAAEAARLGRELEQLEKRAADEKPHDAVEVNGKYYRPKVQTFMYDKRGRVLASRSQASGSGLRAYDNYKFPGGGIEPNEDVLDAARKELLEEAGYTPGGEMYEFGERTPVDWDPKFREQAAKKGRGAYHGQYEYYVAGPLGKRDRSRLGSEGDAMTGLELVDRKKLRRALTRTANDPGNEYGYFDKQKLVALDALERELARREKTAAWVSASLLSEKVAGIAPVGIVTPAAGQRAVRAALPSAAPAQMLVGGEQLASQSVRADLAGAARAQARATGALPPVQLPPLPPAGPRAARGFMDTAPSAETVFKPRFADRVKMRATDLAIRAQTSPYARMAGQLVDDIGQNLLPYLS